MFYTLSVVLSFKYEDGEVWTHNAAETAENTLTFIHNSGRVNTPSIDLV